jgi:hypothetical protein
MLKFVFWILLLVNGALFAYREGYLDAFIPSGREPARLAQQFNADKIRLLPQNARPADQPAPAQPTPPADKPAAGQGDDKTGSNADKHDATQAAEAGMTGATAVADAKAEAGKLISVAHNPQTEKKPEPEKKTEADKAAEAEKQVKKAETDKNTEADKKTVAADKVANAGKKAEVLACTEIGNFNEIDAGRFEARLATLAPQARVSRRLIREASSHIVFIPPQANKEAADRKVEQLRSLGITDFYLIQDQSEMRWGISLGVFSSEESARKRLEQLKQQGVRTARIGPRNTITKVAVQVRALDGASRDKLEKLKSDFPQQQQHSCA